MLKRETFLVLYWKYLYTSLIWKCPWTVLKENFNLYWLMFLLIFIKLFHFVCHNNDNDKLVCFPRKSMVYEWFNNQIWTKGKNYSFYSAIFSDICAPVLIVHSCSICASNVLTNMKLITSLEIVIGFKVGQVYLKTQSIIFEFWNFLFKQFIYIYIFKP